MMKITASVDRFEGDWAILMVGEKKMELPREFLPQSVQPGGWVDLTIEENQTKEAEVRKNVSSLLEDLKAGKHLED